MTERKDTVWQLSRVAENFLSGIRGAIPFAAEQVDIMARIVSTLDRPINAFVDLGCGNGALGAEIHGRNPEARGIFIDFSPAMLDAARKNLGDEPKLAFLDTDYGEPGWTSEIAEYAPIDVVVSGYSIHHSPDERKRSLYAEIFDLLAPGGIFVNVEHVAPGGPLGERLFEEHFVDNLLAIEQAHDGPRSRDQIAEEFRNREDIDANILAPLDVQCQWLRDIGFEDVDCQFKIYELAVFSGMKP